MTTHPFIEPCYACPRCGEELRLERVHRIEPSPVSERLNFWFVCPCSDDVIEGNVVYSPQYMRRLFGEGRVPMLPWTSPIKAPADISEQEGDLRLWRWEVEQLADYDELLRWLAWLPFDTGGEPGV